MLHGLFELRRNNRLSSFCFVWYASAPTTTTEVPATTREQVTTTTTTAGTLRQWRRGRERTRGNFPLYC